MFVSPKAILRNVINNKYDREQKIYCIGLSIAFWLAIIYIVFISSSISRANDRNHRISLDLTDVEKYHLDLDAEQTKSHNENCSYWDCFNVYRCGERLSIYVYPLQDFVDETVKGVAAESTLSVLSREFFEILKVIIESPYYTPDPKEACVLVPSIDTLNLNRIDPQIVAKALATLP